MTVRRMLIALGLAAGLAGNAQAAEAIAVPTQSWSFDGLFGTFDRAAVQRGFQVYQGVCAGCHGAKYLAFRNLQDIGLDEDTVRAIAAGYTVTDGPNDAGEMFERPGQPSDRLPSPFPNEQAARAANNGAYPPDLSLIAKARANGPNYLHALLTGYHEPPADATVPEGMYYNAYFPGHMIAMPPPLSADAVEYGDGTSATVEQMASDVTQFLMWIAEPKLEERKATGVKVVLFLIVLSGLLYAYKRRIWADVH
jgi:ubiquinol-cytochrome c reductase cytochrome c1 subunit